MKKDATILVVLIGVSWILAFYMGQNNGIEQTKTEFKNRSLELAEKDNFTNQDIEHILFNTPLDWENYSKELQQIGYSKNASEHIAKVEFNYLVADAEYNALIDD